MRQLHRRRESKQSAPAHRLKRRGSATSTARPAAQSTKKLGQAREGSEGAARCWRRAVEIGFRRRTRARARAATDAAVLRGDRRQWDDDRKGVRREDRRVSPVRDDMCDVERVARPRLSIVEQLRIRQRPVHEDERASEVRRRGRGSVSRVRRGEHDGERSGGRATRSRASRASPRSSHSG